MALPSNLGDAEIATLADLGAVLFGQRDPQGPPDHWLEREVVLRNDSRSIQTSVPKEYCRHAGIDTTDPPTVKVYFDPHTQLVFYDLPGLFRYPE